MRTPSASDDKLLALLALRHAGVSPRALWELFMAPQELLPLDIPDDWACYTELLERCQTQGLREIEACSRAGVALLPCFSPAYPAPLRALAHRAPLVLYLQGSQALLACEPRLTIIGTRSPSREGYEQAYRAGGEAAQRGELVISGLARGCDEAAHRGALDACGKTVAILPAGIDRLHPAQHRSLAARILSSGGLLMTEYPLETPVDRFRLVQRDRLQASLGQALLVIECGEASGTMHTVRFAERYGRKIYALPAGGLPSQGGNRQLLETGRAQLFHAGWYTMRAKQVSALRGYEVRE